ncbi:hypothetical protein Btru_030707 [Bulinus truncatus]|nr:hypothetical protein Btru_030707 [Bulinus truncatus]
MSAEVNLAVAELQDMTLCLLAHLRYWICIGCCRLAGIDGHRNVRFTRRRKLKLALFFYCIFLLAALYYVYAYDRPESMSLILCRINCHVNYYPNCHTDCNKI